MPGRIMVTSSSDVPMKGLVPLLEAVAKLRTERDVELVVIGNPRPDGRGERTQPLPFMNFALAASSGTMPADSITASDGLY